MSETCFWAPLILVLYSYAIYPVVLLGLAAVVQMWRDLRYALGRVERRAPSEFAPPVSIVVPAYNEEAVIEAKLRNILSLDYPRDNLDVIVVSDGSSDRTNDIVTAFGHGVKLIVQPVRSGKPAALNTGIAQAAGELVILTDANTLYDPAAVRKLVRHFADGRVGVVCGELKLTPAGSYHTEKRYWDYERLLKFLENKIGAVLGANGAIYAIRRSCYRPIPNETWVDDFVIAMKIREAGFRIVYDTEAVAFEETARSVEAEFVRKARIGAGNFQALSLTWRLLNPLRGVVAFSYWSHKVLRWFAPFFMMAALVANVFLIGRPFYQLTFALQAAMYGAGIAGHFTRNKPGVLRVLSLPYYFVFMNAAMMVGFLRWLTNRQRATWKRTER